MGEDLVRLLAEVSTRRLRDGFLDLRDARIVRSNKEGSLILRGALAVHRLAGLGKRRKGQAGVRNKYSY